MSIWPSVLLKIMAAKQLFFHLDGCKKSGSSGL